MIRGVVKKTRIFYGQAGRKGPLTDFFWCVQKERCCFGPKTVQSSNLLTVSLTVKYLSFFDDSPYHLLKYFSVK